MAWEPVQPTKTDEQNLLKLIVEKVLEVLVKGEIRYFYCSAFMFNNQLFCPPFCLDNEIDLSLDAFSDSVKPTQQGVGRDRKLQLLLIKCS